MTANGVRGTEYGVAVRPYAYDLRTPYGGPPRRDIDGPLGTTARYDDRGGAPAPPRTRTRTTRNRYDDDPGGGASCHCPE
ncbi:MULTISPECIES: hypothetical protein [unclassified Streptomyces]|uniref:hypothetical protein n=1 Tax=unclassified Streptomyces TaxID=2593676 RepID=UPI0028C3E381|nr:MULTISPECIES: hypothetical protein [unclassified Streptomyces]WNO73267.1 hypothetical protein RPQ07_17230 [Streptomyces sp. AM8-1-1]